MICFWGLSDVGLKRKDNQDAFAIEQNEAKKLAAAVVCDGMGGVEGGALASRLAVDAFIDTVREHFRPDMSPEELREMSLSAVNRANKTVFLAARNLYPGMGTTLVSAVAYPGGCVVTNIGDSRVYRITEEGIERITKDHSLMEEMIDRGEITPEEARYHPDRNVITRALGTKEREIADAYLCPMRAGEYLLLCTDGLIDTVSDQEMLFEVIHDSDTDTCLERLLAISMSRGAPDNVTGVLLKYM